MHVRVDDAREDGEPARLDGLLRARLARPDDRRDTAVADEEVGVADAVLEHDATAPDGEVDPQTSSITMSCAPSQSTSRPSSARCSRPSTIVAKWLPASCPALLAKTVAP